MTFHRLRDTCNAIANKIQNILKLAPHSLMFVCRKDISAFVKEEINKVICIKVEIGNDYTNVHILSDIELEKDILTYVEVEKYISYIIDVPRKIKVYKDMH